MSEKTNSKKVNEKIKNKMAKTTKKSNNYWN